MRDSRFAFYSDGLGQVTGLTPASSDRCGEGSAKQCPAGTRGTQACLTTRTTRQCKTSRRHAHTLSQSGADAAPGTAYTSLSLHPLYARVHVRMCVHTLRQARHTHTHLGRSKMRDLKCARVSAHRVSVPVPHSRFRGRHSIRGALHRPRRPGAARRRCHRALRRLECMP